MHWGLYDTTGKVIYTGVCPDGEEINQVIAGLSLFVGFIEPWDFIDTSAGTRIPGVKPDPSYSENRFYAYPSVGQQLDALWHAMEAGEIPKASEFFEMIKRVKDRHPDPDAIGRTDL